MQKWPIFYVKLVPVDKHAVLKVGTLEPWKSKKSEKPNAIYSFQLKLQNLVNCFWTMCLKILNSTRFNCTTWKSIIIFQWRSYDSLRIPVFNQFSNKKCIKSRWIDCLPINLWWGFIKKGRSSWPLFWFMRPLLVLMPECYGEHILTNSKRYVIIK